MQATSKMSLSLVLGAILIVSYTPVFNGVLASRQSLIAESHIINGVNTDVEKVPYQVSIEHRKNHACGGAIISVEVVITAAHCIQPFVSEKLQYRVRVGASKQLPLIGWGGTVHDIMTWYYHPKFNVDTVDYDVGLIRVFKFFKFNAKIQQISIPTDADEKFLDYNKPALASGFGMTKVNSIQMSFHLKSAEIPLLSRESCRQISPEGAPKISPRMICGAPTGIKGSDVHIGDSGGPLVQSGKLIGVVSWGLRDVSPNMPSIYANLLDAEIRYYINQIAKV